MRVPRYVLALGFAIILGVVVAAMVVTAIGYSQAARTVPLLVGVPTIAFIVLQIVRDVVRVKRGDTTVGETSEAERDRYAETAVETSGAITDARPGVAADRRTSMLAALFWVGCLALLIWLAGLLLAIPAFMAAFMRIFGRERWSTIAAFAVTTTVAVYLFFAVVLEVQLYAGAFGDAVPWP